MSANERLLFCINYTNGYLEGLAAMADMGNNAKLADSMRLVVRWVNEAVARANKREQDEPPTMADLLRETMPDEYERVQELPEDLRTEFFDRLGRSFSASVRRGLQLAEIQTPREQDE